MCFMTERLATFRRAYSIFCREFYRENSESETVPYLCSIHDVFGLVAPTAHNCLGCNFADLTTSFDQILSTLADYSEIFAPFSIYILWLYLFVERYEQVMGRLSVPDSYKKRHFQSFQCIRRWANFVKHPKAFLFTHHPEFLHGGEVGDDFEADDDSIVVINQTFIDKYYASVQNDSKLYKTLANATEVIVVFPDPEALMIKFANDTKNFVRLIEKNEVYREVLSQITTIEQFFIDDEI